MSLHNLAAVFGPNVLRAKAEDPQSVTGGKGRGQRTPPSRWRRPFPEHACFPAGAALVQVLMLELIREHRSLFAKAPPHSSARLPAGLQASPGRAPHLQPPACCRQLSLPLISERSRPESPQDGR